jgi:hypothetical protein
MERTTVRWPRLWAAFSPEAAQRIIGQGEELSALCQKFDLPPQAMLRKFQRHHAGKTLLPADWVQERGDATWADLAGVPMRQACHLTTLAPAVANAALRT